MFFELRQYHVRPGQQAAWVKCMEEEIIPFQVKMGMVILGSFVGEEYWKNEIAPRVPTLIDREQIKVTRLVATPRSVIQ
ncbi:MAG: NIPSNAP family protein [Candidatus Rokubacteria bacterium]|nr:NIPSNAP family protein [Candidatus Rokubacteria bacterium]